MKIAFTQKIISPEVGIKVAGYGPNDVSVTKSDDLTASFLALDDGAKKLVICSYDLLGIDEKWIKRIRSSAARAFGGSDSDFILSCTHTHSGPNTRTLASCPEILETEYLANLEKTTVDAVKEIMSKEFRETNVFFYSISCDENINRRYIGPENKCSFLPHRRDMERIADGVCDKELGGLFFADKSTGEILYVIGNYAAHPLASHSPGIGGHRISADFPGFFRDYIRHETGAECMFISGAAGDMVPRGHETGLDAARSVGVHLAKDAVAAIITAQRCPDSFKLANESLQSVIVERNYTVRPHKVAKLPPDYKGKSSVPLEMQLASIGDVCLVGVPGEFCAELGLEIKWNSPFRKTFILYCSTAYFEYICHGNALVSGGYEGSSQYLDGRGGLALVKAAQDGAYELYERTFPNPSDWTENKQAPLVALKNI